MKIFLVIFFLTSIHYEQEQQTGEQTFTFNERNYDAIVVNPREQTIRMHWLSKEQTPYKSIGAVKKDLEKDGHRLAMITNGGMYLENNSPQGLFIDKGRELRPIDSALNKYGNFYMQPNGIFYLDGSSPHVSTTKSFIQTYYKKKRAVSYATQSGPMLVIDGRINEVFNPKSTNFHLRSGVGILPNGNVVFVISRSNQTTFYDLASIFKDRYGCKNALYLDGAISRMYLPGLREYDVEGSFGAIISVSLD